MSRVIILSFLALVLMSAHIVVPSAAQAGAKSKIAKKLLGLIDESPTPKKPRLSDTNSDTPSMLKHDTGREAAKCGAQAVKRLNNGDSVSCKPSSSSERGGSNKPKKASDVPKPYRPSQK
ncbi:MAG: hypothetical protein HOE26_08910 [Rhodospirillaceae bacterium]|jgi:hypothetical protein|nr:hypothetical protein [Rhodospirillaceae bacterium]